MKYCSRVGLFPVLFLACSAAWATGPAVPTAPCRRLLHREAVIAQVDAQWRHNRSWNVPATPEQLRSGDLVTFDVLESAVQSDLEGVGDFTHSPFTPRAGVVRLFVHYRDTATIETVERGLQARGVIFEKGSMPSRMHSSRRTVLLLPDEDQESGSLKLSGHWEFPSKRLDPEKVRRSVARSVRHQGDPEVVAETAGLIFRYGAGEHDMLTGIYRPSELGGNPPPTLKPGERVFAASTLFSPSFWASEDSAFIRATHATPMDWIEKEFAPEFGAFLFNSLVKRGSHFVAHTQNLNVHLNARGAILKIAGKDLADAAEDPMIQLASGMPLGDAVDLPGRYFVNEGSPLGSRSHDQAHFFTLELYRVYAGQIDMAIQRDLLRGDPIHPQPDLARYQRAVQRSLIRRAFAYLRQRGLDPERRRAYGAAFTDLASHLSYDLSPRSIWLAQPYGTFSRIRELLILLDMDREFRADSAQSAAFESSASRILFQDPAIAPLPPEGGVKIENWFLARHREASEIRVQLGDRSFVYGTYRGKPAAVRFRPNGTIENYLIVWGKPPG